MIATENAGPLLTQVAEFEYAEDGDAKLVTRLWAEADMRACGLCHQCTAAEGPMGLDRDGELTRLYVCSHGVRGLIDVESAPGFSPDGLS